jgi:hypothetical protein
MAAVAETAAPVLVGTMLAAAARARRNLCGNYLEILVVGVAMNGEEHGFFDSPV